MRRVNLIFSKVYKANPLTEAARKMAFREYVNAGYLKTYSKLRIQAELDVQERLGKFVTTVTRVPPVSG